MNTDLINIDLQKVADFTQAVEASKAVEASQAVEASKADEASESNTAVKVHSEENCFVKQVLPRFGFEHGRRVVYCASRRWDAEPRPLFTEESTRGSTAGEWLCVGCDNPQPRCGTFIMEMCVGGQCGFRYGDQFFREQFLAKKSEWDKWHLSIKASLLLHCVGLLTGSDQFDMIFRVVSSGQSYLFLNAEEMCEFVFPLLTTFQEHGWLTAAEKIDFANELISLKAEADYHEKKRREFPNEPPSFAHEAFQQLQQQAIEKALKRGRNEDGEDGDAPVPPATLASIDVIKRQRGRGGGRGGVYDEQTNAQLSDKLDHELERLANELN